MSTTQDATVTPDFNTISSWTAADYALLTANLVQSMTLAQVQAMLHPEQVPTAAVSAFTPEQISSIKVTFYPTAAWINALSIPALQALSPAAFYHVTRPQLVGVDAAHLSALTAAQVAGTNKLDALSSAQFGLLNISGMSVSQIAGLTAMEYAGLSAAQISSLSPSQVSAIANIVNLPLAVVSGLTANQLPALTIDFSTVSVNWLNALSPDAFRGLSTVQIAQISAATVCALDNAHISALTASQFGALNISGFSTTQIASLNATEFSGLTASQISSLSPEQVAAIPNIGNLPLAAVNGLTANQLAAITTNLSTFSVNWLNALNTNAFQSLSTAQIAQISAATVRGLDNAHLNALSASQVTALNGITSLSSAQFGLLDLTAISATTMAQWGQSVWAGTTALQMSLLTTDQINAMQNATWLPLTAVSGIMPSQVLVFTANYGRFSGTWFNQMRLDSFQTLDNGRLAQISAANWAQIDFAHFSALNAAQIGVIKLDFSRVSADWINGLSLETFQGLTATQIGQLTATTVVGLSDARLSALTATQIEALNNLSQLSGHQFSLLNLSAMSSAQIAAWTPDQYAALTSAQFNTLSTAQIGAIANPAALPLNIVSALTVAQVNAINTDFSKLPDSWLNSLSTTALQGLTPYQFSHLSSLTAVEVLNITNIAALSNTQFSQLNLTGVSASVMAGWSSQVWAGLTAAQVSSFTAAQIDSFQHASWLPATAAAGLLPWQMAPLSANYGQFSADWFNHLQLASFTALDTSRLSQISWSAFFGMDSAHLTALSAAQVASMTNLGSMPSRAFGQLNISALSTAQISALTLKQYQGLSQTQLSSFSSAQIQALAHPEWLAPGLINNISVAQFSAMTAAQFAGLSSAAFTSLDAAHLAVWPGDATALTQQELLEVRPRLTATQLNALTDNQRTMLTTSDTAAQSLINSLSDAGLKSIMQSVASGAGTLFSFNAIESVMKTLDAGISDGLTASQYAGLQSYTQAIGQVCGENSSIYSLVNSMVNAADGASVNWTGADGTYSRIGNLAVGSTSIQFGEQISAWLDGTNDPGSSNTYYTDGRLLFGDSGTPTINDISQGSIGDCSMLGALQTVVNVQPDYIKSMITQNANGSYSVRFFNGNKAEWVTVDNQTCSYGEGVSGSSWAAIFERASATFKASFKNSGNSYESVGGFGDEELQAITGDKIISYSPGSYSEADWNTTIFNILKTAVLAGQPTDIGSFEYTKDAQNNKSDFISGHEMAIISFDENTNNFVIANPWGAQGNANFNGTFEASMDQMWQGGNGNTSVHIANSDVATGAVGQLVTAMASIAPTSAATSGAAAPAANSNNALLVASQVA
ncbi:C2 family cysteine protease [Buttiauxella gaviniae]|uniref:C2 family cysteine protease n=1 Tax=Buttiauxella gaviniae TaxID=82990 RepID=A0ABV3NZM6_9ENTR